jgi:monoamine oxidase
MDADWAPLDRMTWPDWLRSRGASPGALALMTVGGDSRELSALYVLRQWALLGEAALYKIQGGMDRLPRAMAAQLGSVVRYGAVVTSLEPGSDSVGVEYRAAGQTRTVRARGVVVTLPPGALRRLRTRDAALQQKLALLAEIASFPAVRFLVETRRRGWHDAGLSGFARTDRPAEIWDAAYDSGGDRGLLAATCGGEWGRQLARVPHRAAVAAGVGVMRDAFPEVQARGAAAYRWALDPWARGAFAAYRPGQMTRIMPAVGERVGRVAFAGEHTAAWTGWLEGALRSADSAVGDLLS